MPRVHLVIKPNKRVLHVIHFKVAQSDVLLNLGVQVLFALGHVLVKLIDNVLGNDNIRRHAT